MISIKIQNEDFDLNVEQQKLRALTTKTGAIVSFTGLVRDLNEGQDVACLELECYPAMVEKTLQEIAAQAQQRWDIQGASIIHRIGKLGISEQIVYVGVSSMHRGDAFSACEFIMDFLKTRAPFWKKESSEEGEAWLDARESDEQASSRWS